MAREVNTVLGQIISEERGIPEAKAEEIVKGMRSANQYQVSNSVESQNLPLPRPVLSGRGSTRLPSKQNSNHLCRRMSGHEEQTKTQTNKSLLPTSNYWKGSKNLEIILGLGSRESCPDFDLYWFLLLSSENRSTTDFNLLWSHNFSGGFSKRFLTLWSSLFFPTWVVWM